MENKYLELRKLNIEAGGILNFFEWCDRVINNPCESVNNFTKVVAGINLLILREPYREIFAKVEESRGPVWKEWLTQVHNLKEQWADRDLNGRCVYLPGTNEPKISNYTVEYRKACDALAKEDKFEKMFQDMQVNDFSRQPCSVNLVCVKDPFVEISLLPGNLVNILYGGYFSDLLSDETAKEQK